MKDLIPFEHPVFGQVRVFMMNGAPMWVASDVAKALGYEDPADAVQRHCKKVKKISQQGEAPGRPPVNFNIIPEPDIYRLIMRSNLPKAEEFQDWVVEDMLPTLNKTGRYEMPGSKLPRHSEDTQTRRALARILSKLASRPEYPSARKNIFLAEAASVLSGNPIEQYLPPVTDGRERWQSPTQLSKVIGCSPNAVGRALKAAHLHGDDDSGRNFSEVIWNKSRSSDKQVPSYLYDPDFILPKLREALQTPPRLIEE